MRAALIVLLVIPAFVLLSGCASGIEMSDEERIACRNEGCSAWTQGELRGLVNRAASEGYRLGWRDANKQAGRGL